MLSLVMCKTSAVAISAILRLPSAVLSLVQSQRQSEVTELKPFLRPENQLKVELTSGNLTFDQRTKSFFSGFLCQLER